MTTLSLGCFSEPPSTEGGSAGDSGSATGSSSEAGPDEDEDDDEEDGDDTTGDEATGGVVTTGVGGSTTEADDGTGETDEPGTTGAEEAAIDLFDIACDADWLDGDASTIDCPSVAAAGTPGTVLLVENFNLPPPERGTAPALLMQPGGSSGLIQASWIVGEDMLPEGTPRFVADGICIVTPPGGACSLDVQVRLFRDGEDLATGIIPIVNGPPTVFDYNFNNTAMEAGDEVLLIVLDPDGGGSGEAAAFIEPRIVFD